VYGRFGKLGTVGDVRWLPFPAMATAFETIGYQGGSTIDVAIGEPHKISTLRIVAVKGSVLVSATPKTPPKTIYSSA
jgi:hypothetical protein